MKTSKNQEELGMEPREGAGRRESVRRWTCGDSPSSAGLRGHGKNLGLHPRGSEKLTIASRGAIRSDILFEQMARAAMLRID